MPVEPVRVPPVALKDRAGAGEVDAVVGALVELTLSNASVAPAVPVTSTAGPRGADVGRAGRRAVTVPALLRLNAGWCPTSWSGADGRRTSSGPWC